VIPIILALLPPVALGWMLVRLLLPPDRKGPVWLRWIFEISLGAGLGAGITSCLFFLLLAVGVKGRVPLLVVELGCEAGVLGVAAFFLKRRSSLSDGRSMESSAPSTVAAVRDSPATGVSMWTWLLRLAALVALVIFSLSCAARNSANPAGEWDAFTIWNLRAKFLAGGSESWRHAVIETSSGALHPTYPLLAPSFLGRTWLVTGNDSPEGALAADLLFTFATLGLLCGAVAVAVNETAGLLAALVLLASDNFAAQSVSQYADVPLAFYILAVTMLLAIAFKREWPPPVLFLAGVFAGFAPWTKNEGQPFLIFACIVAIWQLRKRAGWMLLGALPGAAVTALFKIGFARGAENLFPPTLAEAASKMIEPARWTQILSSFGGNVREMGVPWAHPILLLAILGATLGFAPHARARLWIAMPLAGLLAVDFAVYLVTMSDLSWHLATSNSRLIMQVWPALLFAFFLTLRAPVLPQPAAAAEDKQKSDRRHRKR